MKYVVRIFCIWLPLLSPALSPGFAQPTPAASPIITDLNGDGRQDTVIFSSKLDEYDVFTEYTLSVNGRAISVPLDDTYDLRMSVVDVDRRDSVKEIAVTSTGANDRNVVTIYIVNGSSIGQVQPLVGMVEYRGDGVAASTNWMGFWSIVQEYSLDRSTLSWLPMVRDTYDVGVRITVTKPFHLYESRDEGSKASIKVKSKSTIDIISCDPSPACSESATSDSGECDWYLIRTSNGNTGWARLKDFRTKTVIPWAG